MFVPLFVFVVFSSSNFNYSHMLMDIPNICICFLNAKKVRLKEGVNSTIKHIFTQCNDEMNRFSNSMHIFHKVTDSA